MRALALEVAADLLALRGEAGLLARDGALFRQVGLGRERAIAVAHGSFRVLALGFDILRAGGQGARIRPPDAARLDAAGGCLDHAGLLRLDHQEGAVEHVEDDRAGRGFELVARQTCRLAERGHRHGRIAEGDGAGFDEIARLEAFGTQLQAVAAAGLFQRGLAEAAIAAQGLAENGVFAGNLDGRHRARARRRRLAADGGRGGLLSAGLVKGLRTGKLHWLGHGYACKAEPGQGCAGSEAMGSRAAERRHGCFLVAQGAF